MFTPGEDVNVLRRSLESCCIFIDGNGTLGIVPDCAQEGDKVCFLQGAFSPCLLRSRVDGGWNLVSGDCFIYRDSHCEHMPRFWTEFGVAEEDLTEEFLIC